MNSKLRSTGPRPPRGDPVSIAPPGIMMNEFQRYDDVLQVPTLPIG